MPFDEKQVMESCATFIKKDCQLDDVQVFHAEDESISFPCDVGILHSHVPDPMNRKKEAKPASPPTAPTTRSTAVCYKHD